MPATSPPPSPQASFHVPSPSSPFPYPPPLPCLPSPQAVSSSHQRDRERVSTGRALAGQCTSTLRATNVVLGSLAALLVVIAAGRWAAYLRSATAPPFDGRELATQPWVAYLLAAAGALAGVAALLGLRAAGTASRLMLGAYLGFLTLVLSIQGGIITAASRYGPSAWPADAIGDEAAIAAVVRRFPALVWTLVSAALLLQARGGPSSPLPPPPLSLPTLPRDQAVGHFPESGVEEPSFGAPLPSPPPFCPLCQRARPLACPARPPPPALLCLCCAQGPRI